MRYTISETFKSLCGESVDMDGFEIAVAHCKNGKKVLIRIDQALEHETEIKEFFCPVCGRSAVVRHNIIKDPCFMSRWHKPNCQLYLANSKRKKVSNLVVGTFIDMKKAIMPNRKLTKKAKKFLKYKNGIIEKIARTIVRDPADTADDDRSQREIFRKISATKTIYDELKDKDSDFKFAEGIRKIEFLLDQKGLYYAKKRGIKPNEPKMAITRRVLINSLQHPFDFDREYILLRDKFSTADNSALFFIVRVINERGETDEIENKIFQYDVTGFNNGDEVLDNLPKDRHDSILIMSDKWLEFGYEEYTIYATDIYSDDYCFFNY